MSPMIDLQRKHAEVFRLRLGDTENGRPRKLTDSIRVTSPNRSVVDAFVAVFGGETQTWEQQFEAYLPTTELPIMVLPGQSISQWWEKYKRSVCERRCDGEIDTISGNPCVCPVDLTERMQAKDACRPMTRVNVVCPDVAVVGAGSLVTHGMVAAETLPQSIAVAEAALSRGLMVPAVLRVVEHKGKTHYVVPQIEIVGISLNQLTTGEIPQAISTPTAPAIAAPAQPALPVATRTRPPEMAQVVDTKPLPAANAERPRPPLPNEVASDPAAKAERELDHERRILHSLRSLIAENKRGLLAKEWKTAALPEREPTKSLTAEQIPLAQQILRKWVALSALEAAGFKNEKDRHRVVGEATGGATESTKDLSAEQLKEVIDYCTALVESEVAS